MSNPDRLELSGAVIGSYRFSKKLGRGGFADVYLADQQGPGSEKRSVAIKILVDAREDRVSFQETFKVFRNETDPLLKLSAFAPMILQIFTCEMHEIFLDEHGNVHTVGHKPPTEEANTRVVTVLMIVMEYADGGTLADTYRQEVVLGSSDFGFLSHFADVCKGLQVVHDKGIVHRDIKPQNLFWFRNERRVKLGDFGIAKYANEVRLERAYLVGSIPYMSPESFETKLTEDPRRDVYALGCTLYEVLTGECPFDLRNHPMAAGESSDDTFGRGKQLHFELPRPDAIKLSPQFVSLAVNELLKRMMAVDPDQRPSLEEAAAIFQHDKERRTVSVDTQIRRAEDFDLPDKPLSRLTYNINPHFRMQVLDEAPFFFFITMAMRSPWRMKQLLAHLHTFFYDTFSFYETVGRYDFVVRVWAPSDGKQILECGRRIRDKVLEGDGKGIRVMQCDEVEYLGAGKQTYDKSVDMVEALVKIDEVQRKGSKEAEKWLIRKGIYSRKLLPTSKRHGIKCFCLVRSVSSSVDAESEGSMVEREAKGALLAKLLQQMSAKELQHSLTSVYRRTQGNVPELENLWSEFVIKYIAKDYDSVAEIPGKILGGKYSFHTSTLLATTRYFIESDNVLLTREHKGRNGRSG